MAIKTHEVEVVPVKLEQHPNADTLSVVKVHGFTVCVRTADWNDGDKAAYIQPDSIVDCNRPEFSFLEGHSRIRVKKLRGVISMGLLVKAPEGSEIGDNVAEVLGVEHYEPALPSGTGGQAEAPPSGVYAPHYDVENLRQYNYVFDDGEEVWASEKIHGCNSRFVYTNGRMWAGSRSEWKKKEDGNLWWMAVAQNPWIEKFCESHPDWVVYAEVYGSVQSLKYGCSGGQYKIAVFDILRGSEWLNFDELYSFQDQLEMVPVLYCGPFNIEVLKEIAEGESVVPGANHIREGIVVKPVFERTCLEIGRVKLKLVSNKYLEKN